MFAVPETGLFKNFKIPRGLILKQLYSKDLLLGRGKYLISHQHRILYKSPDHTGSVCSRHITKAFSLAALLILGTYNTT